MAVVLDRGTVTRGVTFAVGGNRVPDGVGSVVERERELAGVAVPLAGVARRGRAGAVGTVAVCAAVVLDRGTVTRG
ncbi:hypothetical protein QWJ26_18825 [Streptomyces sp. CSDS2]|uniref:hypothetical protein n=1 Tax=Streptomyces sp. CSDS2 TaxID=3055051 RepID=UPI0025AFFE66|nr:hypothetical protein [Streptomyces sp. CSDS2]MDN3261830.1 hypothetical protein [Streptomyces sp. CSDS2]